MTHDGSKRACGPACAGTPGTDPARALDGRGWDAYLIGVAALTPFVGGVAGSPLAWCDVVNLAGLAVLGAVVLARRVVLEVPLALPALLVATGSVLAVAAADSVAASALALAQDAYLYLWMIALVALMRRRGEMLALRAVTAAVAVLVALACLAESWRFGVHSLSGLLSPTGHRSLATLGNANLAADFLMLGAFTLLGLDGRVPRLFQAAGLGVLVAGILTTKSNGPLIAMAAGLTTWALVRARAAGIPARRLAGAGALTVAILVLSAWLVGECGLGGAWLHSIAEHTVLARVAHSSETRGRIWERLEHRVATHPLGIGPGNSSAGDVEIGERERKGDLRSKEAHSDYLGYTVERGPFAVAGLLVGLIALGGRVFRARRLLDQRMGSARRGVAVHAASAGVFVAMLIQSLVIEQLHFRHVWWLLAWTWAATGDPAVAGADARTFAPTRPVGAASPSGAPA